MKSKTKRMIQNIIIVGLGKAGLLHYNSFKKLNINNIYLVDKYKTEFVNRIDIFKTISELIKVKNLSAKNVIVDLTAPVSTLKELVNECKKLGIKNVIVEKPFIIDDFKNYKNLNIIMVQNYLYSKIYNYVKNYIKINSLKILKVNSNFSKDRRNDSSKKRGLSGEKCLECMYIETPHQLYLVQDLIGKNLDCIISIQKDMILPDQNLEKHGCCYIRLNNKNTEINLLSNLKSNLLKKNLVVHTNNNISISANFITYMPNLDIKSKGTVRIFKDCKLIEKIDYEEDDMMTYMFEEYITCFQNKKIYTKYLLRLKNFSLIYKNIRKVLK